MCPSWKFIQNTILYLRTVLFVLPSVKKWAASLRFYFGAILFIKQQYFLHNLNSTIICYTTFTNILLSCEPKIYTPIDKCRFHSLSLHCMELKLNQLLIQINMQHIFHFHTKKGAKLLTRKTKKKDDYTQTFMSFTFQAYKTRLQASYIGASSDISHISAEDEEEVPQLFPSSSTADDSLSPRRGWEHFSDDRIELAGWNVWNSISFENLSRISVAMSLPC